MCLGDNVKIPEQVKSIIETIEENGYEAYAVGGCVRDTLLGRVPDDWDITTSANPIQVKALFRRTIDTGIQHGTVTVMIGDDGYEVTTYRMDGESEDHRHPRSGPRRGYVPAALPRPRASDIHCAPRQKSGSYLVSAQG